MAEEDGIPEGVYWNQKETMFFDAQGKRMGGKFFDQWKDRREEFPTHVAVVVAADTTKRRRVTTGHARLDAAAAVKAVEVEAAPVDPDLLEVAMLRKKLFDAYVEVGFTEDQALELCIR